MNLYFATTGPAGVVVGTLSSAADVVAFKRAGVRLFATPQQAEDFAYRVRNA